MLSITVLSPHRDDAVFSLACWMRRWVDAGRSVSVINFYTVSQYGPRAAPAGDVSSRRAYEDHAALFAISPAIRVRSHRFVDAPLRMNRPVDSVMGQETSVVPLCHAKQLHSIIRAAGRSSYIIAPLSLGGHMDHLAVQAAAVETVPAGRLGFYEDLPYAAWTSSLEKAARVERVTRAGFPLVRFDGDIAPLMKQNWAARYRSQIGREDAMSIARYGSERIWAPKRMCAVLKSGDR